ncbi:MAG: hypothetical protein LQ348_005845 [Seirophora lacunosa]|nr:MAG: hypothetical protein LQ344_008114 [Seirophora lacunosa]KAI4177297.1 MAG: hypothetical protein LQ348_005845 [Seirophora lacunosa]
MSRSTPLIDNDGQAHRLSCSSTAEVSPRDRSSLKSAGDSDSDSITSGRSCHSPSENYDADEESGYSTCLDAHSNNSSPSSPLDSNGHRSPPSYDHGFLSLFSHGFLTPHRPRSIHSSTRFYDFSVRHYDTDEESGYLASTPSPSAGVTDTDVAVEEAAEERAVEETRHDLTEANVAQLSGPTPSVFELLSGARRLHHTAEEIEAVRLAMESPHYIEWEELAGPFGPDWRSCQ